MSNQFELSLVDARNFNESYLLLETITKSWNEIQQFHADGTRCFGNGDHSDHDVWNKFGNGVTSRNVVRSIEQKSIVAVTDDIEYAKLWVTHTNNKTWLPKDCNIENVEDKRDLEPERKVTYNKLTSFIVIPKMRLEGTKLIIPDNVEKFPFHRSY